MKINEKKVQERLREVPPENRSHIYDASIVLEFLAQTFMPTRFFLPAGFSPEPGMTLGAKSMRNVSKDKEMSIGDLYDLYQLFREEKDYTAKIESRYIFGIIVRHLRYYKNGWEFIFWRVGGAQIWHLGPLLLRKDVPADIRKQIPPRLENRSVAAVTVEADPVTPPEEDRFIEAAPGLVPCEHEATHEEIVDALRVTVCNGCNEIVNRPHVDEGF